jgi:hypothetical protein
MTISDTWQGVLSAQDSRLEVLWDTNQYWDGTANSPEFIIPGNTRQSQWFIEPGSITLYSNTSKPYKNMQTITFNCEIDSTTNFAPSFGSGQSYDQNQAAGTDPVLLNYGVSSYPGTLQKFTADIPGAGTALTASTALHYDSTHGAMPSSIPSYPSFYKLYVLHVFTPGKNQGSYLISNHTNGTSTITIMANGGTTGSLLNGAFVQAQSGVQCGIELFQHNLPIGSTTGTVDWANSGPDIQTDLQTNPGAFTLTATLYTWATGYTNSLTYKGDALHKFSIVPYYLLTSKLLANTIVPTWAFTCKCIIRESDTTNSDFTGKFVNLWE